MFYVITVFLYLAFHPIIHFSRSDKYFLCFLAVTLLSGLQNSSLETTLLGQPYRYQGILLFVCLILAGKLVTHSPSKLTKINLFLSIIFLVFFVLNKIGFSLIPQIYWSRYAFTFGNPNFAAFYFVLLSVFASPLLLLLNFLVILATGSLFPLAIFFLTLAIRYLPKYTRIPIFIVTTLLLFAIAISDSRSFFDQRSIIWHTSLTAFTQKPLLGYGLENFATAFSYNHPNSSPFLGEIRVDKAHNLLLEIASTTGLCGMVFFLLWQRELYFSTPHKHFFWIFHLLACFNVLSLTSWLLFFLVINTNRDRIGGDTLNYGPRIAKVAHSKRQTQKT